MFRKILPDRFFSFLFPTLFLRKSFGNLFEEFRCRCFALIEILYLGRFGFGVIRNNRFGVKVFAHLILFVIRFIFGNDNRFNLKNRFVKIVFLIVEGFLTVNFRITG